MLASTDFHSGDIVCPMPKFLTIKKNSLILPDETVINHSDNFNVIIISHFLIAIKPIDAGTAILLNFNVTFFDLNVSNEHISIDDPVASGFRYLEVEAKQKMYVYADETVRQQAIEDGFIPSSSEIGVTVVRKKEHDLVTVAEGNYASDAVVFRSTGIFVPFPVRSTIELPGERHLRLTGGAEFLRHSCLPNLKLEIHGTEIAGIALRPIESGEILAFNYLCTEWEVTKVFHCACNVYCCYGVIKGFKYLDPEQQNHLLPQCSDSVTEKYYAAMNMRIKASPSVAVSASLATSAEGFLASQKFIPAGTVLFSYSKKPFVDKKFLLLDQIRIPHGCDANVVVIGDKVVTCRPLTSGDVLYCNINCFMFEGKSFSCDCGSPHCTQKVEGFHSLSAAAKSDLWMYCSSSVQRSARSAGFVVPSLSDLVDVRATNTIGDSLFASQSIPFGTHIFNVYGLVIPFPTVYTIYLGEEKHLLFSGGAQYLAHSCTPNTRIVVDPVNGCFDCFALRDIEKDEVISFNYLTTEWDMSVPFQCLCGAREKCLKVIEGFQHLSKEKKMLLWGTVTQAVRARYAHTLRSGATTLAHFNPELIAPAEREGSIMLQRDAPSGTVLFKAEEPFEVVNNTIRLGDVFLQHSCNATAALLENFVVLRQACFCGTRITLNVNQLVLQLKKPFSCNCGALTCCKEVKGFFHLPEDSQNEQLLLTAPSVRSEAVERGYLNRSCCPLVEVRANGEMGQATFAARTISVGTRFFEMHGLVIPFPTVYTIMLEPGRHLLFCGGAQCLAHSCSPNVRIVVDPEARTIACLAIREIKEGELISFNYLTSEWDMNTPFKCACKSPNCFREIKGFSHLSIASRQILWSMATPAIRSLAASNFNWKQLCGRFLYANDFGRVCAASVLHKGEAVLEASKVTVRNNSVLVEDVLLFHSCEPTACIIGRKVVLLQTVCADREITIDLNLLSFELDEPFECSCRNNGSIHTVKGFKYLPATQQSEQIIFVLPSVASLALKNGYQPRADSSLVEIKPNGGMGNVSFAKSFIRCGSRFLQVQGLRLSFPTTLTVMLNETSHLLFGGGMQYLAHSCEPNVRICIDDLNNIVECEALRDIQEGEMVAYDYNTTEWDMANPFTCLCGSKSCVLTVRGHKYLTFNQRARIRNLLSPAMRELAGMYSDIQLPPNLEKAEDGSLIVKAYLPKEQVVLEVFFLDIQPSQICVGRDFVIPHSNVYNCVFVEGRVISSRPIYPGERLSVNLNYFVYDMTELFPRAYAEDCKGFRFLDESFKQKFLYLCEPPVRRQAMLDGWVVVSPQKALQIRPNGDMGQTAYATDDIPRGTTLFHCTGLIVPFPTMYTIWVGERQHLLFGDGAECIAHHCDPNVQVKVNGDGTFDFVTVKDIKIGEMVTFNYNTTEWHMNTPFPCLCGSEFCAGTISGFRGLQTKDRQRLWPITSPLVRARCETAISNAKN